MHGGGRQTGRLGQVGEAQPAVPGQQPDDLPVDLLHARTLVPWSHWTLPRASLAPRIGWSHSTSSCLARASLLQRMVALGPSLVPRSGPRVAPSGSMTTWRSPRHRNSSTRSLAGWTRQVTAFRRARPGMRFKMPWPSGGPVPVTGSSGATRRSGHARPSRASSGFRRPTSAPARRFRSCSERSPDLFRRAPGSSFPSRNSPRTCFPGWSNASVEWMSEPCHCESWAT